VDDAGRQLVGVVNLLDNADVTGVIGGVPSGEWFNLTTGETATVDANETIHLDLPAEGWAFYELVESTPIPTPTPRVTPGPELPNLLANASFDDPFVHPKMDDRNGGEVAFPEVTVAEGWQPFFCDWPYTAEACPAERRGDGNPDDLLMGRPEFKRTDLETRVTSGTAQQWFCFFRACRAGIYQVVETPPDAICDFGVWVQTWSAGDWIGDDGPYTSFYQTDDERANSSWRLGADPTGGTYAWADTAQWGEPAGYDAGHFDHFALVTYQFQTTGTQTTVFIENLRLWPFAHNDSYVDDAYLRCTQ
jgi:hypothetical protein